MRAVKGVFLLMALCIIVGIGTVLFEVGFSLFLILTSVVPIALVVFPILLYVLWYLQLGKKEIKEKKKRTCSIQRISAKECREAIRNSLKSFMIYRRLGLVLIVFFIFGKLLEFPDKNITSLLSELSMYIYLYGTIIIARSYIYLRYKVRTPSLMQAITLGVK